MDASVFQDTAPEVQIDEEEEVSELREAAEAAGLVYVSDDLPGISRRRSGTGFSYRDPQGKVIRDAAIVKRIASLAIPPAYEDVWICADPNGHIQATGRDAKGRKQYRYHPRWREVRDSTKYEHVLEFARGLPALRARIEDDMGKRGLPREKVLATVVHLLETTLIRVGNEDYVRQNKSYGLTTLRNRHVKVEGGQLRFHFKGKSGKTWNLQVRNPRVAKIVRSCQELPGQDLFQYRDDEGQLHAVTSADVNEYLKEATGEEITAKDFRTWAGTVLASLALREFESFDNAGRAKKNMRQAIESVAAKLGNTPSVCRKCYIHPEILNSYVDGTLLEHVKTDIEETLCAEVTGLRPEEAVVLAMLQKRLSMDLKDRLEAGAAAS